MQYKIINLDDFGRGITKIDNKVCFIKNTLEDEIVDIEIISEKKNYKIANVKKYIKKSSKRINPKCKYYNLCGGCNLEHISLEDEEVYKVKKVENILKKFAKINVLIDNIVSLNEYYYRNKITLRVRNKKIGLLEEQSNNFVEIDKCLLVVPKINEIICKLKELVKEEKDIYKIMIRVSNDNKFVMIKVYGNVDNRDRFCNICDSLIINDDVIKNKYIVSSILDKKFYVSANSFFQINNKVVEALYEEIVKIVRTKNSNKVLDLYCGVGTIGICISDYVNNVLGIEVVEDSIRAAKKNKDLNKIENIDFKCGKVEDIINDNLMNFDTIIVDPPRMGINNKAISVINNSNSSTIIYVSCDPITLARDIKRLDNYELENIKLFNMFPRTYHVECLALLRIKKEKV